MKVLRTSVIFGLSTIVCMAQQQPAANQAMTMQIILEQKVDKTSRTVNPQHVFKTGDLVRFRFRSSFNGYLYVTDRAASGKYLTLFPGEIAGTDNRLIRGRDYLIPATKDSWFRIDKPSGYETVFFVVSSAHFDDASSQHSPQEQLFVSPSTQPLPGDMQPRCDDATFRARGECLDANAGASALQHVGIDTTTNANLVPREIVVIRKTDSSVVAPATDGDAPIIYQFRIAHR
jgi:hypothetical protein